MNQILYGWRSRSAGAVVLLAWLTVMLPASVAEVATAKSARETRSEGQRRAAGKPLLAIVSLSDQRISIYDAAGKVLEAPVSTGSAGYETPAGIFSVVQKKEMHSSNLYQDGEMPFMQRITWTGIALHAGVLPGRPASHGCIRLPMGFAQHLFGITDLGMRVLIVRDDMAPSEIAHPLLFRSNPTVIELASNAAQPSPGKAARFGASAPDRGLAPSSARHLEMLQSIAAARTAEVEKTNERLRAARAATGRATSAEAAATRLVRVGEANLAKAESALQDIERRIEASTTPQARERGEATKAKVAARRDELQVQLQAARLAAEAKRDDALRAQEDAQAAAAASEGAAAAAEQATRQTLPVSVFVSRKTQRLYVRKGNYPIYEGPVTIGEAEMPIGTFIFTALEPLGTSGDMRWNVVAMYRTPLTIEPTAKTRDAQTARTDAVAAKSALDRIGFTREALEFISGVVWPGSSLIISDEGPSREMGKDTDFVVVMSGEPQGALKIRQREPMPMDWFERSPFRGWRSFWN
jgi:hypothetical protein